MSGGQVSAPSDVKAPPHPSLKRQREEVGHGEQQEQQLEQLESDRAEEEEGLVALVKKRFDDVQLLVRRMSTLKRELAAAEEKYATAKRLLREAQGVPESNREEVNLPNEGPGRGVGGEPERDRPKGKALVNGAHEKTKTTTTTKASKVAPPPGSTGVSEKDVPGATPARNADRRDSGSRGSAKKAETKKIGQGTTSGTQPRQNVAAPPVKHTDVISSVKTQYKIRPLAIDPPVYCDSTHKRKFRSIVLNPSSQTQFATSSLDGLINFWQIHPESYDIKSWYRVDAFSERRWPDHIAWHPDGHSLFGVYKADDEHPQVCIIRNDDKQPKINYMQAKPHTKGPINAIEFMPWDSTLFATAGSDHMVNLWHQREDEDNVWEPRVLHRDCHTSTVSDVAGTRSKQLVLSAGKDKRLIGFDPASMKVALKIDLDGPCLAVLPNAVDFNLVMVGTSQRNQQLHLFDIRVKSRLHVLGWQQEKSESAYIMQTWSPDGFYIASGSSDPKISIFDIRYNGSKPIKVMPAHTERVVGVIWHQTLPVLLSISSDYKIGRHKITSL